MNKNNRKKLDGLIKRLRELPVNPDTKRAFRISSVYGSAKMEDPSITLEDVVEADKRLRKKRCSR